ncbi:redoxin domain-containing protein [Microbulbifer sp. 2201CG32-9]|uniref:redoxin domain-containing protein n=1 Tax=Microbulbifer sp. 2201CG32-9 TaxID=3232309 RepID=UPI00345BC7DD
MMNISAIENYVSQLELTDIEGNKIPIGNGNKIWLSIFREATCPFCNIRVYEMTQKAEYFLKSDIRIVAIFKSSSSDTKKFIAQQPRPFQIVADPDASIYRGLSLRSSFSAKLKAILLQMPRLLRGLSLTGTRGLVTSNQLPADILLDGKAKVLKIYTAKDISDHIPFSEVDRFI